MPKNIVPISMQFDPVAKFSGPISLCVPEIRGNEWKYVKECLDSGWVSSVGSFVARFENDMARFVGARRAVATVNGTSALHVALLAAGIQPDDEVLVSTLTFIAPANAIRYTGAWPVFVDAEAGFWQMDVDKVANFLVKGCTWRDGSLRNNTTQRRVRAIVPVHILGHPVDIDPLLALARKFELIVIEDATESLGARYKGRIVGHLADAGCFSYNGNKLLTTGGGGMFTTDNETWAKRAKYLTTQAKDDPLEYVHAEVGFNYRLTNLQAAMGCAQLEQVGDFIAAKQRIADRYRCELADIPGIQPMPEASWAQSVFWMYTIRIDAEQFGMNSRQLYQWLSNQRIETRPLWQPLHMSKAHGQAFATACEVAERLYRDALSLPCSVGLTEDAQASVIAAIRAARR